MIYIMSSTNKTQNFSLNSWIGSDIPSRVDFNSDNSIIDDVLGKHIKNNVCHITDVERKVWNSPVAFKTFFGDGTSLRKIDLACGFTPSAVIIFSNRMPLVTATVNGTEVSCKHYFGVASKYGSSLGTKLSGQTLTVEYSPTITGVDSAYEFLNEQGKTYICLIFR